MLIPDFYELVAIRNWKSKSALASNRSINSIRTGNHYSPYRGQGLEFDAVREYVPGDDIRNIDWKVTARTGSPHLKLFKQERERNVLICVDMNAHMRFGTKNTFKSIQAARIAAFLGWKGIANQDQVSACLFGDVVNGIQYFPPKRTKASFCSMLKVLAEPPSQSHSISLEKALNHILQNVQSGSLIYVISDFMDIDNLESLKRLKRKCNIVFVSVNDPSDESICPVGSVGFLGNSEKLMVNTENSTGRAAYTAQWNENRKQLKELSVPTIKLTTESNIHRELQR